MRMNFGEVFEIQDLGDHPALTAIILGILLAGEVDVTPDPKCKDFYKIESRMVKDLKRIEKAWFPVS